MAFAKRRYVGDDITVIRNRKNSYDVYMLTDGFCTRIANVKAEFIKAHFNLEAF